jgi:hypothetical protein
MKTIITFFDRFEDRVREGLSKRPILYALLSGVGIVFFFRGVWMTADGFAFLTGWVTLGISVVILLITGTLVSHFIHDTIIASGLLKKKKLTDKPFHQAIRELNQEATANFELEKGLEQLNERVVELEEAIKKNNHDLL